MPVFKFRPAFWYALLFVCVLAPQIALSSAVARSKFGVLYTHRVVQGVISPPLRPIKPEPFSPRREELELRRIPRHARIQSVRDPVLQGTLPHGLAPEVVQSFDGLGELFSGPDNTFEMETSPPDPAGDVGLHHYVQLVNMSLASFDKNGAVLYGPLSTSTLWKSLGGDCAQTNDGDGIVLYDELADRWFITQLSVSGHRYFQCVAVSATPDPTGPYHLYAFPYDLLPDYGKFGIWPDGYYATFNLFGGQGFEGGMVCAYERDKMLVGQAAGMQCTSPITTTAGGMLPADLDGSLLPPYGTPNYILTFDNSTASVLQAWTFHVDWVNPSLTKLNRLQDVPVAAFSVPCGGVGDACIPQPGTNTLLDSLGDRPMFRLAYRNLAETESLIFNHTVDAGGRTGIRWYELQRNEAGLTISQQGTYSPDTQHRWLGSGAMDQVGNVAFGYSVSSADLFPSIHYAGRLRDDPPGILLQGEGTLMRGSGVQLFDGRWGDYSAMGVDPADGCTFWYTSEYLTYSGLLNWHTRIGSFKFPNCPPVIPNDFSLSTVPRFGQVVAGTTTQYVVTTVSTNGTAESLSLSAVGLPAGVSVSFSPPSMRAGEVAVMTLATQQDAPLAFLSAFNVVATSPSAKHAVLVNVSISRPINDFTFTLSPENRSLIAGETVTFDVETLPKQGSSEVLELSTAGLPKGVKATFAPSSVTVGERATLILSAAPAAPAKSPTPFVVVGAAPSVSHAAIASVEVVAPPSNDFAITLEPAEVVVRPSETTRLQVRTAVTSGSSETVELTVSDLPSEVTGSLAPRTIRSGESATLSLSVAQGSRGGKSSFKVSGSSISFSRVAVGVLSIPSNFALTVLPLRQQVSRGTKAIFQIGTTLISGSSENIKLSVSGLPADVDVVFDPPTVAAGESSQLMMTPRSGETGTFEFTVHGTSVAAENGVGGTVEFLNVKPPKISLVPPAATSPLAGVIILSASLEVDPSVHVAALEFRVDGALQAVVHTSPARFEWNTEAVPNGAHLLEVTGRDSDGNESTTTLTVWTSNNTSGCSCAAPGSSVPGAAFSFLIVVAVVAYRQTTKVARVCSG